MTTSNIPLRPFLYFFPSLHYKQRPQYTPSLFLHPKSTTSDASKHPTPTPTTLPFLPPPSTLLPCIMQPPSSIQTTAMTTSTSPNKHPPADPQANLLQSTPIYPTNPSTPLVSTHQWLIQPTRNPNPLAASDSEQTAPSQPQGRKASISSPSPAAPLLDVGNRDHEHRSTITASDHNARRDQEKNRQLVVACPDPRTSPAGIRKPLFLDDNAARPIAGPASQSSPFRRPNSGGVWRRCV